MDAIINNLLAVSCLAVFPLNWSNNRLSAHGQGKTGAGRDRFTKEVLSNNPDVILEWKCDLANNKVHFKLSGKTDGWVGIGIADGSETGMANSDIAIGGVHHGYPCVKDMWAAVNGTPKDQPPDEASQDIRDKHVEIDGEWLNFRFSRYRKDFMSSRGASMGDMPIEEDRLQLVTWALGNFDPGQHCRILKHDDYSRGYVHLELCPKQILPISHSLDNGVEMRASREGNMLTVEISAPTKADDWLGFGFSPDGTMKKADIFTAYTRNGMIYLQDRYSLNNSTRPLVDDVNNWQLIEGSYKNGRTTIRAARSMSGDGTTQDMKIRSKMNVIWAKGAMNDEIIQPHGSGPYDRGNKNNVKLFALPTIEDLMEKYYSLEKLIKKAQRFPVRAFHLDDDS